MKIDARLEQYIDAINNFANACAAMGKDIPDISTTHFINELRERKQRLDMAWSQLLDHHEKHIAYLNS